MEITIRMFLALYPELTIMHVDKENTDKTKEYIYF